jgi:general secretion pathway protein A
LYHGFYNLKENPFRLTPDPAFMCMTAQHQEALSGLIYSVCTRPGLTVLMGEAGTGKTTLLYSLLGLLEKRRFVSAICTNPTLTREEFYDTLMIKFGLDCGSSLKSRQLTTLEESIRRNRSEGRPSVLIVDEAQRLSPELLEEIRLLLNMETATEKLLQIIVAGQPELGEVLRRPDLRQLKQRVSCVCKLKPLSIEEVKAYLHHRLTRAGLPEQSLFPEETIELLYGYSQGIPRLINSLCDGALQTGFAVQSSRITTLILEEAAKDLELVRPIDMEELPFKGQMSRMSAATVNSGTPSKPLPVNGVVHKDNLGTNGNGRNGSSNGSPEVRIPLNHYATRQKNGGLLGSLIKRWK